MKHKLRFQYLGYGAALALGAFFLELIQYRFIARTYSVEIAVLLIAVLFLALGIWVGGRTTSQPVGEEFQQNTAAMTTLGITKREFAVLELLAVGQSNKQIARQLSVSPNTVKTHLANLFQKLEVERRTQAVARARSLRIVA